MGQLHYDHKKRDLKREKGLVVLLSILIFSVVGMAFVSSLMFFGIGQLQSSFSVEQSGQARALANACAEEALQQINDSVSFSGTGNLSLSTGTCNYTVIVLSGANREIEATGTVDTIVRKVFIALDQINPNIHLTSWQEVADF